MVEADHLRQCFAALLLNLSFGGQCFEKITTHTNMLYTTFIIALSTGDDQRNDHYDISNLFKTEINTIIFQN